MVDCAGGKYGDLGCDGGIAGFAMLYTDAQPLMAEEDYPYEEKDAECRFLKDKGLASASGFTLIEEGNPYMMQAAVDMGPMTVGVDAGSFVFQLYKKGVFNHPDRCGSDLNHAITVVGYSNTKEDATPYWIVRNSWGPDWGEDGYIRIAISDGIGNCGINIEPTFPNIYFTSTVDSTIYLFLSLAGIILSLWPLIKLSWCKNENLLYLNDGQKGLVKLAYVTLSIFLISTLVFGCSLGPITLPIWMLFRSGLFIFYASVHCFLCCLHYLMGSVDRARSDRQMVKSTFDKVKVIVLGTLILLVSVVALTLVLLEN